MKEEKQYTYQEDVEIEINKIMKKREQIMKATPTFYLEIDKAPYILPCLFNTDGTPNGDFNVPEKYQKRAQIALQHQHSGSNGYWYGNNSSDEYLIKFTPDFLSEEELDELQSKHYIMKRLGNTDVKLKQIKLGIERTSIKWETAYAGTLSDLNRKKIRESRELLKNCDLIIKQLRAVQSKLPHLPREVYIDETTRHSNQK